MGTRDVVWALIFDKQYETHPISLNEWARTDRKAAQGVWQRWSRRVFIVLIVALMVGGALSMMRVPGFLRDFPILINVIINMLWAVPVSSVVAQAVQRERIRLSLPLLLLTSFTAQSILLAKAVASFGRISKIVISGLLTLSWFGIIANLLLIPLSAYSTHDISFWIVFAVFVIFLLIIERLQELALSVTIGLYLGSNATSSEAMILMNFILSLTMRVVHLLILVLFTESGTVIREPSTLAWLNLLMGTSSALVYAPTLRNLLLVTLVIGGRELIIRLLLRHTVRRVGRTE